MLRLFSDDQISDDHVSDDHISEGHISDERIKKTLFPTPLKYTTLNNNPEAGLQGAAAP